MHEESKEVSNVDVGYGKGSKVGQEVFVGLVGQENDEEDDILYDVLNYGEDGCRDVFSLEDVIDKVDDLVVEAEDCVDYFGVAKVMA